jgi:anthranilate phosphoribosyltransferase
MAGALCRLGTRRAFLVCGQDGLDEVSLHGPTHVREVFGESIRAHAWVPEDFGLVSCDLRDLQVSGSEQSAAMIRSVLAGDEGPAGRVVLANSAAALVAVGRASSLAQGVAHSRLAIQSGRALSVLGRLIEYSRTSERTERALG